MVKGDLLKEFKFVKNWEILMFSEQVNSLYNQKGTNICTKYARVYMLWKIKHCPWEESHKKF